MGTIKTVKVRTHHALVLVRHDWAQTLSTNEINRAIKIEDHVDGRGFTVTNEDGVQIRFRIHENQ